jgi:hypothetical protein
MKFFSYETSFIAIPASAPNASSPPFAVAFFFTVDRCIHWHFVNFDFAEQRR